MAKRARKRKAVAPKSTAAAPREMQQATAMVLLAVALAFSVIVRLRLLDLPLERDEGEYAYAGQLLLQGIPPYSQAYNMKFPGMYAAYALLMAIFGQSVSGIRIGLMVVNAATTVMLYFLVQRLFGRGAAVIAAAAHAVLSLEIVMLGPYAHATHFVNAAVVGALLLMARGKFIEDLAAGVLLAVAVLMKQQAAAFALFALIWSGRPRRAATIAAGGVIVAALAALLLAVGGVFGRFWFWTIRYAGEYVGSAAAQHPFLLFTTTTGLIFQFAPLLWLLAGAGLIALLTVGEARTQWKFLAGYTLAAFVAISPGLYFREHYFIVLIPPASILIALAVAKTPLPRVVTAGVFALAIVTSVARQWDFFFVLDRDRITKTLYNVNPFVEAVQIANYLEEQTSPADRIAILGSEPEIFFYAKRKSATGYIYTYPLMEQQKFAHRMQEEMIGEIERARPKYLLMVTSPASWLRRDDSDLTLFAWERQYVRSGWVIDGIADIGAEATTYVWGAEAQHYIPKSKNNITLFRRAS